MAGILERVKFLFTGRASQRQLLQPMARVDAAQTSDENKRHWANADALSADAAYDDQVRTRVRNRARYEALNNSYARGSVRAAADDLIVTGPRRQIAIPGADEAIAKKIERSFQRWMDETKIAIHFRIAEKSDVRDGDCFGLKDQNDRQKHPVKLFIRWLEGDLCSNPFGQPFDPFQVGGIRFDRLGLPVDYTFLTEHPGGLSMGSPIKTYTVPAERVVHWFQADRFGQHRAIPELTASLPLYSQLRRYTLATLTAAEFAAMLSGVMKSNLPAGDAPTSVDRWSLFEMVRGALLTLPDGWEATQFKPEQPAAPYGDFKREILNEAGRSLGQPLNVVTGNSSGYNYSSGRLDHVPYHRGLRIRRNDFRLMVLDPIWQWWCEEALLVGEIPENLPALEEWSCCWQWDGFDSIDNQKDADTDDSRLKNGSSTYAEVFGEYGQDWQQQFEQLAKEKAYAEKLGLPWPILAPSGKGDGMPANSKPQPKTAEEAVQYAMAQAGLDYGLSSEVIEMLRPEFDRLKPSRNGKR